MGNLEATKLCLVAAQNEGNLLREKVAALEDTNEKYEIPSRPAQTTVKFAWLLSANF